MSRVTFKVDSPVKIKAKLKFIEIGFKNAVETNMVRALLLVEKSAKENVPVKSGRLRRSIRGGITDIGRGFVEGTIGANTNYAGKVEFGKGKKRLYLTRAIAQNKQKIQQLLSLGLKSTLKGFKS